MLRHLRERMDCVREREPAYWNAGGEMSQRRELLPPCFAARIDRAVRHSPPEPRASLRAASLRSVARLESGLPRPQHVDGVQADRSSLYGIGVGYHNPVQPVDSRIETGDMGSADSQTLGRLALQAQILYARDAHEDVVLSGPRQRRSSDNRRQPRCTSAQVRDDLPTPESPMSAIAEPSLASTQACRSAWPRSRIALPRITPRATMRDQRQECRCSCGPRTWLPSPLISVSTKWHPELWWRRYQLPLADCHCSVRSPPCGKGSHLSERGSHSESGLTGGPRRTVIAPSCSPPLDARRPGSTISLSIFAGPRR